MFRSTLILISLFSLLMVTANASQACDGKQHSDCFSESHYKTIAECDLAIKRNKSDFHAWLDRAILKNQVGQEAESVVDINQAMVVLGKVKS